MSNGDAAISGTPTGSSSSGRMPGSLDYVILGKLPASSALQVSARLLGARIETREVLADARIASLAQATGLTFIFRYGVAVAIGGDEGSRSRLDAALLEHVVDPTPVQEIETAGLLVRPDGGDGITPDGQVLLSDASPVRLLLVATVLARSVVLARDEILVSEAFDRIAPMVGDLRENGRVRLPIKRVMQLVGDVLTARHRVLGTVQANERPDLLWDHPDLDRLYARLEAEYELSERAEVLERKFAALGDFTEVLLNIVQDKRAFRLEGAIIALIAFEIMLSLFNMIAH